MTTATTDTTTEKKLPVLKENVATVSAIITEGTSFAKDGTATVSDNLYVKTLPEGTTAEHVEAVRKHDTAFIAAGTHAIGMGAVAAFASNKDLKEVSVSLDMLGGTEMQVHVQDQVTYPGIKDAAPSTKYGVTTTKLTQTGTKSSSGQLGAARTLINAAAAAAQQKANK